MAYLNFVPPCGGRIFIVMCRMEKKEGSIFMCQKEQIIRELQRNGKRITQQRKILLDVILEGNWNSCKEIYYTASKRDSSIGLATVYRMLGMLEEMGFLSRGYQHFYPPEEDGVLPADGKQPKTHI